jgi:deoxyribodipyrimidine photo-lyase
MPPVAYEPTPAAALARLEAVDPTAYARTRNHLEGAVTGLGPYLTHGLLSLPQVRDHLVTRHRLHADHKLVFELTWREYFRHVWAHEGDGILASLHEGPLPEPAYARELPADLRQARTGVPAIDFAVRQLYATGTLHNHARMWLASYTVHLRKVAWRAGADGMLAHLLDGDLASNPTARTRNWTASRARRRRVPSRSRRSRASTPSTSRRATPRPHRAGRAISRHRTRCSWLAATSG